MTGPVLVTGASSGIGRNITELLAGNGHFVYATARKAEDLEVLNSIDNVQAIRLDVTSQADVDAAVETVKNEGRGLHAIVNNAGVAVIGKMTSASESDIDLVFGANIYGPYRVTKAFAPMLLENQGRIATIGSISGFCSGATDGVYAMSKFAMEAFADSLADELEPQGVRVSIIEPGSFSSPIWRKVAERVAEGGEDLIAFGAAQPEPDAVSAAVEHALFSDRPKRRYMVTPDQEQAGGTLQHAIRRVAELNHDHEFSYSREQLIKMLDEALDAL